MLNIRDVKIDPRSLGDKMLLVEVSPVYEYKDNKRTDTVLGHRYVVALPALRLEKLAVKIDGKMLLDTPADFVEVKFTDLEVTAYESQGHTMITAKATGINVVGQEKKQA